MPKKSYMKESNILNEGFFSKLFSFIKDSGVVKKAKHDRKLNSQLKKLNNSVTGLEQFFEKSYGVPLELEKFKLSDFV